MEDFGVTFTAHHDPAASSTFPQWMPQSAPLFQIIHGYIPEAEPFSTPFPFGLGLS
jgi:hypothetical protein